MTQHVRTHAHLPGRTRFARARHRSLLRTVLDLAALRRQRLELGRMDAHMLEDIGVSREQAASEASRPVWDAPGYWTT
ncbi:DUF1127 domain-containing protein [Psychromarinibacter sp. S121]|uniref:DUF1127 domain-containing protein n=1 Tax=Psychromarinibacter sp. S121 TaxID=3415127 RepID=UPI003C7AF7B0